MALAAEARGAEHSVLVGPQNAPAAVRSVATSSEPASRTVFKQKSAERANATASARSEPLKWRARRGASTLPAEAASPVMPQAVAQQRPARDERVTPASHEEAAAASAPVLRAANESVLAPGTLPRTTRSTRSAPRRLSPHDTRRAKSLPLDRDGAASVARRQPAPADGGAGQTPPAGQDPTELPRRRYGEEEGIPPAEQPPAEQPMTEQPTQVPPAEQPETVVPGTELPGTPPMTDPMAEQPGVEQPGVERPMVQPSPPADLPPGDAGGEAVQPMPDALNDSLDDRRLAPLTPEELKEFCEIEKRARDQVLMGSIQDGVRRDGELDYCERSRNTVRGRKAVDISVDISPPRPKGDDAPRCDREWTDITGKVLFTGRPYDYEVSTGMATFRTVDGELRTLRLRDLSTVEQGHFLTMYKLPVECLLEDERYLPRDWLCSTFTWKASAACHKPLYFEDVHLERYGHSWGPLLQPGASTLHFVGTLPILPYKMGLQPPHECVYTLGYYRPGNCAPYMLDPLPISARAALYEAGAWVAGVAVVP